PASVRCSSRLRAWPRAVPRIGWIEFSSAPLRRFFREATELFHRFVVGLHRGGAFGFLDGIAALLAEALNGLNAPKGAATRNPDRRVADLNIHRVRVQLRELAQRDPTAARNRNAEFQCVNLSVSR